MQFVLTDTTILPSDVCDCLGKVNCEALNIDGVRLAPRTALVSGIFSWGRQHPVIFVDRIRDNTRSWLDDSLGNLGGYGLASVEWYPRSMKVDQLLMRCERPRASRIARILRWLRRIRR